LSGETQSAVEHRQAVYPVNAMASPKADGEVDGWLALASRLDGETVSAPPAMAT
jgi:hypothetical protein